MPRGSERPTREYPNAEKLDLMIEVEEQVAKYGATGDRVEMMMMLRDMAPELLRMARWALDAEPVARALMAEMRYAPGDSDPASDAAVDAAYNNAEALLNRVPWREEG